MNGPRHSCGRSHKAAHPSHLTQDYIFDSAISVGVCGPTFRHRTADVFLVRRFFGVSRCLADEGTRFAFLPGDGLRRGTRMRFLNEGSADEGTRCVFHIWMRPEQGTRCGFLIVMGAGEGTGCGFLNEKAPVEGTRGVFHARNQPLMANFAVFLRFRLELPRDRSDEP